MRNYLDDPKDEKEEEEEEQEEKEQGTPQESGQGPPDDDPD